MNPGVNKIDGNSSWGVWVGALRSPAGGPRGWSLLRKVSGSKTPLDWLKIDLNLAKINYTYNFENTPEKLIWKPPYKFSQPKDRREGEEGQLWSISNCIVKVGVDATC